MCAKRSSFGWKVGIFRFQMPIVRLHNPTKQFALFSLDYFLGDGRYRQKKNYKPFTISFCKIEVITAWNFVWPNGLFDNIVSDPNHKLKVLLPPDYDNSRYNLRRQRHFKTPKLCTNRTSNTFIYAMSKQSELWFYLSYIHA